MMSSAHGQTQASSAPSLLPISEGSRKSFLLSRAVTVKLRYNGDGLVRTPAHPGELTLSSTSTESSAAPAALLSQATSTHISVGIANHKRPVRMVCELLDSNNAVLLNGEAPAVVVPDSTVVGGYRIRQLESLYLQCVNSVPLDIANAESIEIIAREEDGSLNFTNTIYPNQDGVFDVWTWSYRYGEVIVNFKDGSQAFYSFTTGERMQTSALANDQSVVIPNYVERTASGPTPPNHHYVTMDAIYKLGEVPSPPTYRIKVLGGRTLRFRIETFCRDSNGNVAPPPTEWWYHSDTGTHEFQITEFESYDPENGVCSFILNLAPGIYWINAEGAEFRRTYWWWNDGGGKG